AVRFERQDRRHDLPAPDADDPVRRARAQQGKRPAEGSTGEQSEEVADTKLPARPWVRGQSASAGSISQLISRLIRTGDQNSWRGAGPALAMFVVTSNEIAWRSNGRPASVGRRPAGIVSTCEAVPPTVNASGATTNVAGLRAMAPRPPASGGSIGVSGKKLPKSMRQNTTVPSGTLVSL